MGVDGRVETCCMSVLYSRGYRKFDGIIVDGDVMFHVACI